MAATSHIPATPGRPGAAGCCAALRPIRRPCRCISQPSGQTEAIRPRRSCAGQAAGIRVIPPSGPRLPELRPAAHSGPVLRVPGKVRRQVSEKRTSPRPRLASLARNRWRSSFARAATTLPAFRVEQLPAGGEWVCSSRLSSRGKKLASLPQPGNDRSARSWAQRHDSIAAVFV
jgi:hypothetical protein